MRPMPHLEVVEVPTEELLEYSNNAKLHPQEQVDCKVIATCVKRGELTKQQGKTLMGQAKHCDYAGAMRGIERIYSRG